MATGGAIGAIFPSLPALSLGEAAAMLQGLYQVDLVQLRGGAPGVLAALRRGSAGPGRRRLRYIRRDPAELWQPVRTIWSKGGGDCEDLAAATAAELTLGGIPARPVIYRVRPGLAHAVVEIQATRQLLDPSKLGGMGEPQELEEARQADRRTLARALRGTNLGSSGARYDGRTWWP